MSTSDIYNYHKVDDHVITGGQPTEEQLKSAAEEGFNRSSTWLPNARTTSQTMKAAWCARLAWRIITFLWRGMIQN